MNKLSKINQAFKYDLSFKSNEFIENRLQLNKKKKNKSDFSILFICLIKKVKMNLQNPLLKIFSL